MEPKSVDPHNCEGHSKAHKEAFDSLMDRIGKAVQKREPEPEKSPSIGSNTHKAYPRIDFPR